MKYGQTFFAQSVPQWAAYNVDYDELKHLIKSNTSKDQAQAIAIPGQEDPRLEKFETAFYNELSNQHDRVDLFVKSKADEISRRLQHLQKVVLRLLARTSRSNDNDPISQKHRDRFAKYNVQIERCGDDIRSLQRFVSAQRVAFHKILKKYKKWTGSRALVERFTDEVLGNPKSFVRRDFAPLLSQYQDLSINLRSSTPAVSEPTTPNSSRRPSRRPSTQIPIQSQPQTYWNEYDDGSEGGEDEPYTIYVTQDGDSFPGAKTIEYVFSKVKRPMESVKSWFSPGSSPGERQALLPDRGDSYFNEQRSMIDTDAEDEAYASSNEFPAGYIAHYATFPSIHDQKFSQYREILLFRGMVGSFVGALMLIMMTSILFSTGRRKLRAEVDAGAVTGCVASLCFALAGLTAALCRKQEVNLLHRACIGVTFSGLMVLNLMLLFLVLSNIRS